MSQEPSPVRFAVAWRLFCFSSAAIAVAIPAAVFALLFPLAADLPTWDQWSMVPVWEAYFTGRRVWPLILAPYNGHFNVIPRALFFLLGRMTSWNLRVEVVGAYLVCAASVFVLVRMLKRWDRRLVLLAAPFAALSFSLNQYENIATGYGLGQHLSNLAEILTVYWLTAYEASPGAFLAGLGCAAVATFSWGAGVAVWPVGLIAVATSPAPRRVRLAVWTACAGAALFAAESATSSGYVHTVWSNVVPAFLVLLGKSWSFAAFPEVRTSILLGVAVFSSFLALAVVFVRDPDRRPFLRMWGLVGLLGFANGGLICLARSEGSLENFFQSHYVTAVYLSGLAILALAVRWMLDRSDTERGGRLAAALAGVAAVCGLALSQAITVSASWHPVLKLWAATVQENGRKLVAATATDAEIRQSHYPEPDEVRRYVEILRRFRLAAFADETRKSGPPGSIR